MLSDEEKEALRNFKSEYETCDHYSSDLIIELDDAEIILNLIEKQSKEIEELKNKNKKLQDKAKELIFEKQELTSALLDSTPNDKIKAKIEELDIEIQCCEYADDDTEEYKKDIEKEKRRLLRDKKVLQSLLEKE